MRIDDPIEAFQVHGVCGLWGLIAVGIFHQEKGLIYGNHGSLYGMGIQCLGALSIITWTVLLSAIYFSVFKKIGYIRLTEEQELLGGDIYYFAPIKMEGKISSYAKGLQLTRLNSEMMGNQKDLRQSLTPSKNLIGSPNSDINVGIGDSSLKGLKMNNEMK